MIEEILGSEGDGIAEVAILATVAGRRLQTCVSSATPVIGVDFLVVVGCVG